MGYILIFFLLQVVGFAFYRSLKLTPISSFLTGLFSVTSLTFFFGLFNLLYEGRLLFFCISIFYLVYDIIKNKNNNYFEYIKDYFNIFNIIFSVATMVILAIYLINPPLFFYWDEYSFWGMNAKAIFEFNQLLPSFDYIYFYNEGIISGSSILSYVINFFASEFYDLSVYFSFAIVTLGTFALATELIVTKLKSDNKFIAPIIFLTFTLTVFLQSNSLSHDDFSKIHYAFNTSMVDFLLSIVAFSSILLYFSNKKKLAFISGLILLTITKDVGVFFSILSLCIITCFEVFTKAENKKIYLKRLVSLTIALLAINFTYLSWHSYLNNSANPNETNPDITTFASLEFQEYDTLYSNSQESIEETQTDAPLKEGSFVHKLLFSEYRTDRQNTVVKDMYNNFLYSSTTFFLKDTILVPLLMILGFACILFIEKKYRIALLLANLGIFASLIIYILAISLFVANFNDGMVEYPRYVSTYYWIWIYLVLSLVVYILLEKKQNIFIYVFMLYCAFSLYNKGLEYYVIASPDNRFEQAYDIKQTSSEYQEIFDENPRILLVSDRFNDYTYMIDLYYTIPALSNVDTQNSGFNFSKSFSNLEFITEETLSYYIVATDEEFFKIAQENFDYIYIANEQKEFNDSYSEFFNSPLVPSTLFKVTQNSSTPFEVVK